MKVLALIVPKPILLFIIKTINACLRKLTMFMHHVQMSLEWGVAPQPEWMDHFVDLHYTWGGEAKNSFWVERGVFSILCLKPQGRLLDMCCGDGFNSKYFYSRAVSKITAVDFDPSAIKHAKHYNSAPNLEFRVADIRTQFPKGIYDNVIWDAAIEHFHEHEIKEILMNIKSCLTADGILSGYTIVENEHGKGHHLHEREFKSKEDLFSLLKPYFKNVKVFETLHEARHNLYFYASDLKELPFDEQWPRMLRSSKTAASPLESRA